MSSIKNGNKIVYNETVISVGKIRNSSRHSKQSYSKSDNTNSTSYFSKKTYFHGEDANNRLGVTYYPNRTCYLDGYIRENGSWIRGTSEG